MGDLRRLQERFLGVLRVPQIAFEVDQRRGGDLLGVDIGRAKVLRGTEIGVHGALAIRRDQDVGAAGGRAVAGRLGVEGHARGADIVAVQPADLVILDLADIGGAGAEVRQPDNGVGGRAARHFGGLAHIGIDRRGARFVDQRHAALRHAVLHQEVVFRPHQHVEQRVADGEDVVFRRGHGGVPLKAGGSNSQPEQPAKR